MRIRISPTLAILHLFAILTSSETLWPETNFQNTHGHYPPAYCQFTDVVLSPVDKVFMYRSDKAHHKDCFGVLDIWPIQNVANILLNCDEIYDNGHAFTIYYWVGGSNYFHLHYDMLIPLYSAVHHQRMPESDPKAHVFMPTVETRRLQILDWNTKAFTDHNKYWVQLSKTISEPYVYIPLEESVLNAGKNICFRNIRFGTQSVKFSNVELITGFIAHIQKMVNITLQPFEVDRIGVISRSNRRRILNEEELIDALNAIAITERIEFSGMSFREQVALMQRYTVLVGVNGAGLTNGLYLPPHGVAVQIVPFEAKVNFREFGVLLKSRGPYLEWHNSHQNLTRIPMGDKYNNNADTIVHIEDFKKVIYEALELSAKSRHAQRRLHRQEL